MNPTPPSSDDAALRAIEALESESNALVDTDVDASPVLQPPMNNQYAGPATPPSAPPPSIATLDAPEPVVATPVNPATVPSAIAQSLSESLKNAPDAPPPVNLFKEGNRRSKKPVLVTLIIILIIGLGVGGYFAYQHFVATPQVTNQTPAPVEETTPEATVLTDDADAINTEATQMETSVKAIDSSAYDDTSLSDASLYE